MITLVASISSVSSMKIPKNLPDPLAKAQSVEMVSIVAMRTVAFVHPDRMVFVHSRWALMVFEQIICPLAESSNVAFLFIEHL